MCLIFVVPTSGCDAISSEGVCFKYFSKPGSSVNWYGARCYLEGYTKATISSREENTMTINTSPYNYDCWIGLKYESTEGDYVWADGSESTYRQWEYGQPTGTSNDYAVEQTTSGEWRSSRYYYTNKCWLCRTNSKCESFLLSPNINSQFEVHRKNDVLTTQFQVYVT